MFIFTLVSARVFSVFSCFLKLATELSVAHVTSGLAKLFQDVFKALAVKRMCVFFNIKKQLDHLHCCNSPTSVVPTLP